MQFEIHCHTNHSKGSKIPTEVMMSPKEVVRLAKKRGIDGLAITDHKVTTAWDEARREAKKQGIIFIPGQEIETSDGQELFKRLVKGSRTSIFIHGHSYFARLFQPRMRLPWNTSFRCKWEEFFCRQLELYRSSRGRKHPVFG